MRRRLKSKIVVSRIIWICCLTIFFTSVATITVFYFFFGDELVADAVRRVVERTVGYRVSLTGIHLASAGRVDVEEMSLVVGSTTFSSGPAILEFRLGLAPPLRISRVTLHNPSVSVDLSKEGGGDGERVIRKIMDIDIVVTDGDLAVVTKEGRYVFLGMEARYERGIAGAILTLSGTVRTEGRLDGPVLDGPLSARLRVTGTYPDVDARGTITARRWGYYIDGYLFSTDRLDARVRIDRDVAEVTDVSVTGLSMRNETRRILIDGIAATGEMENRSDGPFALKDVRLAVPRLGEVSLDLVVNRDGRWEVTAASDSLRLSGENLRRLGDFIPGFFDGWSTKGRARAVLNMGTVGIEGGRVAGKMDADLIGAGFSSSDSVYLGDGIYGTVSLQFRDDARRGLSFDTGIEAHDFGLLLSDLFVNFKDKRISAHVSGRLLEEGALRDLRCEITVPSVLSARLSGDLDFDPGGTRGEISYRLAAGDLGAGFDLFFRDFFRNRAGWIYTAAVSGSLASSGTVSGVLAAPRIAGSLTVTDTAIAFPDIDTRVDGLSVSLPFSVSLSGGRTRGPTPRFSPGDFGTVTFSHAVAGGAEIDGITVEPALVDNAFTFKHDVVVPLADGKVTIGKFMAGDIFSEDRTLGLSLNVTGVDIAGLFPREKSFDLKGEISGDLPVVGVAGKKLFTSGYLTATIFKGTVRIEKIWGQDLLDAGRRFGCDVTFTGVDLGALTQTIDVGRVTGIAEGYISDFVFSYGGPERFVFDISTVDARGVKKRVSVDFVDKLTILGSGSTLFSGVLKGGIKQFIHDYNYSKIGIHLELKNDYFTLRGTIHEGGTEYFIKRSGLTGINVINQNPDNRIRFNDMMGRLERINVKDTEDIRVETK